MDAEETVFGLVRFEDGGQRVCEIVLAFESERAAEDHAREADWSEYGIGPVRFPASVRPVEARRAVA